MENLSVVELKAKVYDCMGEIGQHQSVINAIQNNIQEINKLIEKKMQAEALSNNEQK